MNITLYQTLFDLQISVCDRFHLSPFQIRRERLGELCLLVSRLNDQNRREKRGKTANSGKIRRPAGDNWF